MLSKINDAHEKFVFPKRRGFCGAASLSFRLRKKTGNRPQKTAANYPLPDPPLVADCEPGIPGGRFVIAEPGDPKTFNPITPTKLPPGHQPVLFWSLPSIDVPSQQVVPGLASRGRIRRTAKRGRSSCGKDLRWSDGEPITADDVVFTWNDVIYNPKINVIATVHVERKNSR